MEKVSAEKLAGMLEGRLDYVLELYVLTESRLCSRPMYEFVEAYLAVGDEPGFCLVYRGINDPEEVYISIDSDDPEGFGGILRKYRPCSITTHGDHGKGERERSFYHVGRGKGQNGRFFLLVPGDKSLRNAFEGEADCYLDTLFCDFVEEKIYGDCGIIGICGGGGGLCGYLAYCQIAEGIRDVSYLYVGEKHRGKGFGKALLDYFVCKNADEGKISYYSFADGEASERLARSRGFLPCALRRVQNFEL